MSRDRADFARESSAEYWTRHVHKRPMGARDEAFWERERAHLATRPALPVRPPLRVVAEEE